MTESSVSHLEIPKSARAMRPCGKHKTLNSLRSQCRMHLAWRYVRPCKICPRRSHISLAAGVGEDGSLARRIQSAKLLSAASITRPGCPLIAVKTAYAFTTLGWPPTSITLEIRGLHLAAPWEMLLPLLLPHSNWAGSCVELSMRSTCQETRPRRLFRRSHYQGNFQDASILHVTNETAALKLCCHCSCPQRPPLSGRLLALSGSLGLPLGLVHGFFSQIRRAFPEICWRPRTLAPNPEETRWRMARERRKYSKICNCEDRIAWNIERKIYEDVPKKEDVNVQGANKRDEIVKMWRSEDVKMWRFEDLKRWRCEQLKMWGCDEMKMWAFKDVRMWWGEDVNMWRCDDVRMGRSAERKKTSQTLLQSFPHKRFYTETLLHTDPFTHRPFYPQTLLHTNTFKHRRFYAKTLLHTDTFTQTTLHPEPFTHKRFYT